MEWRDEAILLSTRRHGETAAIIDVLTPAHGRSSGVVRGGTSRKLAPILQPGAQLDVTWKARLEEHLGTFAVEPIRSRAAASLGDRLSLSGLNAVVALLLFCLPEREVHARLYDKTRNLLDLLGQPEIWPLAYLRWEVALLDDLGFGLDLTECAVLGPSGDDLSFVSPKTGRAVSRSGAGDWAERLLPLPPALLGQGEGEDGDVLQALSVTGHFLTNHVAPELGHRPLPDARARFIERLERRAGASLS
ncbi:MAG: DNA repair protein RecO [Pseudomonadota bacterium]